MTGLVLQQCQESSPDRVSHTAQPDDGFSIQRFPQFILLLQVRHPPPSGSPGGWQALSPAHPPGHLCQGWARGGGVAGRGREGSLAGLQGDSAPACETALSEPDSESELGAWVQEVTALCPCGAPLCPLGRWHQSPVYQDSRLGSRSGNAQGPLATLMLRPAP